MSAAESFVRCSGCGRHYDAPEWDALAHVRTLTSAEVDAYVVGWPRGRRVEVRGCACGRAMARTQPTEREPRRPPPVGRKTAPLR
jgi:hypothetical protein